MKKAEGAAVPGGRRRDLRRHQGRPGRTDGRSVNHPQDGLSGVCFLDFTEI